MNRNDWAGLAETIGEWCSEHPMAVAAVGCFLAGLVVGGLVF